MKPADQSYYAVIFSSKRSNEDQEGYEKMANRMVELARNQKGFRGIESVRGADGIGITISYWNSLEDISSWKSNSEHLVAQEFGKTRWYESFTTKICRVEREYSFGVSL